MIWNCPHCSTVVSLGIAIQQVKRLYVKCTACRGVSMISRKEPATPPPFRALPEGLIGQAEAVANAAETANQVCFAQQAAEIHRDAEIQRQAEIEAEILKRAEIEAECLLNTDAVAPILIPTPPPMNPEMSALLSMPSVTLDPAGSVQITPPRMRPENRPQSPPVPSFLMQGAAKKIEPDFEEKENEEKTEPSISSSGSASPIHQFEFREARGAQKPLQFPKPPEFLTRQNDLLQGALKAVTEKLGPKKSQKSLTIAVAIAAIIAILSGIYLFVEGQKLLQESRRASESAIRLTQHQVMSDTVISSSDSAVRAPGPLRIQVKVPRAILRSAPDTTSTQVGQAMRDENLDVIAWDGSWFQVSHSSSGNAPAWIRNDLVRAL